MPATKLIVSRNGDHKDFPLPEGVKIPKKCQGTERHTYKSGGINFYSEAAQGLHHLERDPHFEFSITATDAKKHLPEEVLKNFNFPRCEAFPDGLFQTA
jgi:hypothetical protein